MKYEVKSQDEIDPAKPPRAGCCSLCCVEDEQRNT